MIDRTAYQAKEDFSRAKTKAVFQSIFGLLGIEKKELLPFYDVKELVKSKKEQYLGMRTIPIHKIVGSEGRYYDFTYSFLPKKQMLRNRWVNIDRAHLSNVNLPPIQVYKLGGVYFVRDGNHRVSVARTQGVEFIDAEVVELDSEISIEPGMTKDKLKRKLLEYERCQFIDILKQHKLDQIMNLREIRFTAPGRYQEVLNHIFVHKYYMNQDSAEEISLDTAARSWFEHVYTPIIRIIRSEMILARFVGRTPGDLYMWVVKHWDDLKHKYGQEYSMEEAAVDYSRKFGVSLWRRILNRLCNRKTGKS